MLAHHDNELCLENRVRRVVGYTTQYIEHVLIHLPERRAGQVYRNSFFSSVYRDNPPRLQRWTRATIIERAVESSCERLRSRTIAVNRFICVHFIRSYNLDTSAHSIEGKPAFQPFHSRGSSLFSLSKLSPFRRLENINR